MSLKSITVLVCCLLACLASASDESVERDRGGGGHGGPLEWSYWQRGTIETCALWHNPVGAPPKVVLFVVRRLPDQKLPRSYARPLETSEGTGFSFGIQNDRWLRYMVSEDFTAESLTVLNRKYGLREGRVLLVDGDVPTKVSQIDTPIPKIRISENRLSPSRREHVEALAELVSQSTSVKEFIESGE